MVELEKIKRRVLKGEKIEKVLEKLDWRQFEETVEEIFKKNKFRTKGNFRFKRKRRYEIDIIAVKGGKVLCIDCKSWGGGRYKKTGLKKAVVKQKERVGELLKFLEGNPIAQGTLKVETDFRFYPLIVTLLEEDLIKANGIFIVPVWKLNGFLFDLERYLT